MTGRGQEVTVKIRTQYDGEGARGFERALETLQQRTSGAARSAGVLSSSFANIGSLFGAGAIGGVVGGALVAGASAFANALTSAMQSAVGLGASLVQASMRMQQLQLGMAAVLGSWYELRDAQGRTLTGVERYNALLQMSRSLMQEIRAEADRTILSTQELTELVQTSIGFAFGKGLTEQQTVQFVSAVAQYGRMMGLDTPMIQQEIRALTGAAPLRTSQIALALGVAQEEVELAGEAFYNALMSKFSALGDLTEQAGQRLDTQWSTFQSNLEQGMAGIGTGLVKGLAQLLASANRWFEELNRGRVFERLGWVIGVMIQSLIQVVSQWIEDVRVFIAMIVRVGQTVITALRGAIENVLNRLGVVGDMIRAGGTVAGQFFGMTPFVRSLREAGSIGATLRELWDASAFFVGGKEEGTGVQATRRTPTMESGESKAKQRAAERERQRLQRAAERERQRLQRERQEAEQILSGIETRKAREAWDALYGVLDLENAVWVVPLMEALENQIAAEEGGKVLARIQANTSRALRDALARQAMETQAQTRRELAGRRESALLTMGAREAEAQARAAARQADLQRQAMRRLYGAMGMEDALLRMDYGERMAFYQEAGYGVFAPVFAGLEVYLPVQQRRAQAQREAQEQFLGELRERGETARAAEQRALERRLRRGLLSPMEFVSQLHRLYQTQRLPEGALGAFESALMEEVQGRLPEQGLFEDAQTYRERWLNALQALKTAYGQWLQNLLHPEQFGQVMESFDALAVAFEQRFIERTESRWKRFVQDLAENLQSGIGNAMVNALERVFRNIRSVGDALRDLMGNILAMIRQTVAQIIYERLFKGLVEQLVETIFNAFGAGRSGGGGGGITFGSVLASVAIGLLTGWVGGLIGLQSGGRAGGGRAYLVGERGVELFVPQSDGVVYPHNYLRKMVGGAASGNATAITVYVNDTGDIDLARRIARAIERVGGRV